MTNPGVGDIVEIPLRTGTVRFIKLVRRNSDSVDWRKCDVCGETFGYGPIGQHLVTNKLVCALDCTK